MNGDTFTYLTGELLEQGFQLRPVNSTATAPAFDRAEVRVVVDSLDEVVHVIEFDARRWVLSESKFFDVTTEQRARRVLAFVASF